MDSQLGRNSQNHVGPGAGMGLYAAGVFGLVLPERGLLNERFLSLDEMKRLIEAAPEPYKTYIWILAETGVRAGEIGARLNKGPLRSRRAYGTGRFRR
jgi:hypothetical protein